jgi:hypothetical protein
MSNRDKLAAVERRLRRLLVRRGWHLMKADKPDKRVRTHGGYMIRDPESHQIVFGDKGYLYSADLEDIKAYLTALDGDRE